MKKAIKLNGSQVEISIAVLSPYILFAVACNKVIPIPVLDDYAIGIVRGAMIRKIVLMRDADLDDESLKYLAWGKLTSAGGALNSLVHHLTSPWTYIKEKLYILSSGEEAAKSLGLGILLNRYIALHKRKKIRIKETKKLKEIIDSTIIGASTRMPQSFFEAMKDQSPSLFKELAGNLVKEARSLRKDTGKADSSYFDKMDVMLSSSFEPLKDVCQKITVILAEECKVFSNCAITIFDEMIKKSPPWRTRKGMPG
jgi:hypothetical protein